MFKSMVVYGLERGSFEGFYVMRALPAYHKSNDQFIHSSTITSIACWTVLAGGGGGKSPLAAVFPHITGSRALRGGETC